MHEFNRETKKREKKGTIKSKSGVRAGINEADDLQLHRNNLTVFEKTESTFIKDMTPKVSIRVGRIVFLLESPCLAVVFVGNMLPKLKKWVAKWCLFHYHKSVPEK